MDTQLALTYFHLATVMPALLIGTYLMLRPKGTPPHRSLGKVYLLLMFATAGASLFLQAQIGPKLLDHFGYIHLLSLLTLYSVPMAYRMARTHNVRRHRRLMLLTYIGGILVAGFFAFAIPGRILHRWLFA